MPRPIRISTPRRLFHTDSTTYDSYLATIAERDVSIELFTPSPYGSDGPLGGFIHEELYNESAVNRAQERGLSVESVHMTPLVSGCSKGGSQNCARKIEDAMLGFEDSETIDNADRYKYCSPDTVIFHPPRISDDDTVELAKRRQQLVATLANACERLEHNDDIDEVPTITIENVCQRGSFTYLLSQPSDIDNFESARKQLQADQDDNVSVPKISYTIDLGHVSDPFAMIEAMGAPAHVHLHGATSNNEATRRELRKEYDLDADQAPGVVEPNESLQHLPPQAGDVSIDAIVEKLIDVGYRGPIVLELATAYWEPEIVHETIDSIRDAGW